MICFLGRVRVNKQIHSINIVPYIVKKEVKIIVYKRDVRCDEDFKDW